MEYRQIAGPSKRADAVTWIGYRVCATKVASWSINAIWWNGFQENVIVWIFQGVTKWKCYCCAPKKRCTRITGKNEIQLPNNVKNISFAAFASQRIRNTNITFFSFDIFRVRAASFFRWSSSFTRCISYFCIFCSFPIIHPCRSFTFYSPDVHFYAMLHQKLTLFRSTSLFFQFYFILHAPSGVTTFSISIFCHQICLQNHHWVFTTSMLLPPIACPGDNCM